MNRNSTIALAGFLFALIPAVLAAQTHPAAPATRPKQASEPAPKGAAVKTPKTSDSQPASSRTISEILQQNFVVFPGTFLRIRSQSDFSGAARASVSMYADPSVNIVNTRIAIWWGVASAQAYAVEDVIGGDSFYFTNVGGANVPVYGPNLFVDVYNDGNVPITIQSLMVYAVAH